MELHRRDLFVVSLAAHHQRKQATRRETSERV